MHGTIGRLSANCTKDDRSTAEACAEVAHLREERAAAQYVSDLEVARASVLSKIEEMQQRGAALPSDPVAELFAWLSRGQLSVRDIGFGFPLVFALLIEIISAFGPAGIAAYAEATRPTHVRQSAPLFAVPSSGELRRAEARHSATGRVIDWMAERTEPTNGGGITLEMLHADYEVWCFSGRDVSQPLGEFAAELDRLRVVPELAGKIRKLGNRYYGIRLLSARALAPE